GSTSIAALPANSAMLPRFDVTTGQPHDIASITGYPNVSYKLGITAKSAPKYTAATSLSNPNLPVQITSLPTSFSLAILWIVEYDTSTSAPTIKSACGN